MTQPQTQTLPATSSSQKTVAIVATHPIQHFVPLYRALARLESVNLRVFFGFPMGVTSYFDEKMKTQISWSMDLLSGYQHEFLEDYTPGTQTSFAHPNSSRLSERLAAFNPDVVMIYGYSQANALRAIFWAKREKVPVILISDSERGARAPSLRERLKNILVPVIYRNIAGFLSVGDKNEDYYRHYGAQATQIFRAPFTIDEDSFDAAIAQRTELKRTFRKAHGIGADDLVVLYVGKMYPGKRPLDFIEAMKRLQGQSTARPVCGVFAGSGEQFEEAKARIDAEGLNIRLLGFINVDQLPSVYASCDVLIVPSEVDRHPLVCSEAACMGMPLIISDKVGSVGDTDVAQSGRNAMVYPCGDVAAIAKAIRHFADDRASLTAYSAASRAIFEQQDMATSLAGIQAAITAVTTRR